MSKQVLTQSEVDALLAAISEGDVSESKKQKSKKMEKEKENRDVVVTYDLTSQDRIIRGRLPQLEVIYERLQRSFRVSLSNKLRAISSVSLYSTEFLKFGEFINTLPMPTIMTVIRAEGLRGPFLLVIESKLTYGIIDKLFGGNDRPFTKIEGKEFTKIELATIRDIEELFVKDLNSAWENIHSIESKVVRSEFNPQFVGICAPSDVVVASTFEVELENCSGSVTIVVPYNTIEPIKDKLSSGFQVADDGRTKERVKDIGKKNISKAAARLTVLLGEALIPISKLRSLKVGDELILNQDANEPVGGYIDGERVLDLKHEIKPDKNQSIKLTVMGRKQYE